MNEELLADIEKRFEEKIHPRGAWYCRGVILYIEGFMDESDPPANRVRFS